MVTDKFKDHSLELHERLIFFIYTAETRYGLMFCKAGFLENI